MTGLAVGHWRKGDLCKPVIVFDSVAWGDNRASIFRTLTGAWDFIFLKATTSWVRFSPKYKYDLLNSCVGGNLAFSTVTNAGEYICAGGGILLNENILISKMI